MIPSDEATTSELFLSNTLSKGPDAPDLNPSIVSPIFKEREPFANTFNFVSGFR